MRIASMVAVGVLLVGGCAAAYPTPEGAGEVGLYVAPWGQDSWSGTLDRPFATLGAAQRAVRARTARMQADIVVNLRAGTYRLAQTLELSPDAYDSGRHGHRVIYQAYGYGTAAQERVGISGGRLITGWRPDDRLPGVWRADVGDLNTRQLFVAGVRARPAALGGNLPGRVTTTAYGYRTDSPAPQAWRNPADIEFRYTMPLYADARCGVAAISGGPRHSDIVMDQPCWDLARGLYEEPLPGEEPEPIGGPTDVTDSPSFLQRAGSWQLDRSRPGRHVLRYRPRPGQRPDRVEVVAPVLQTLVRGTGRPGVPLRDVAFRGLEFADTTWLAPGEPAGYVSAWSMYRRPDVATWLTVPGGVVFHDAERINLVGNRFTRLGAQGLELSGASADGVVEGNVFTDISDGGIVLGVTLPDTAGDSRGHRVANNWVHRVGVDYRAAAGIWNTASRDTTIAHNQVNDVPYNGIVAGRDPELPGAVRGNRIVGNRVFTTMRAIGDGGSIYVRGAQGRSLADGLVVSGNAVTDGRLDQAAFFAAGIYTDDATGPATVSDNVVFGHLAAVGGCDESADGRPIGPIRYAGNFWDDSVPEWIERLDIPGAWPCGAPRDVEFGDNTLLPVDDADQACRTRPRCARILTDAGLEPQYRRLLDALSRPARVN